MTRVHAPALTALASGGLDVADNVSVCAPAVGLWRPAFGPGQLIRPGDVVGTLEVLGVAYKVIAPDGAYGAVVAIAEGAAARAAVPVAHGARLYTLDPAHTIGGAEEARAAAAEAAAHHGGHVFPAPTSGRFYSRPGPGKPPFVKAGDVIRDGHTICLLEVMKTFNRVVYESGPHGLPAEARVVEVLARDEADVDAGAPLIRLEAAT